MQVASRQCLWRDTAGRVGTMLAVEATSASMTVYLSKGVLAEGVPDGGDDGVWSKALGSSSHYEGTYNSTNKGLNFSGKFGSASTIWYPASGARHGNGSGLGSVGSSGRYWSASPGSNAYGLDFSYYGGVYPSYISHRAFGQSVRCLQE